MSGKHRNMRTALAASILSLLAATGVDAAPQYAEGRILVKPAAGLSNQQLDRVLQHAGGRAVSKLQGLDVHIVEVSPRAELAVARALSRNPRIAFAEPDYLLEPVAAPNDPKFANQWHLPKMQAPTAWDIADGSGVTVAVLDTGVNGSHPDLQGKILSGWNTVSNSTDTSDIHGHGTWVAGTIAASTNNGVGVASTAPGTRILPIRISDVSTGVAYSSDAAEGIQWAADHGARVVNLSYGFGGNSTVASAASYMMSKGGVVVVSAGNDNTDPGYSNNPYLYVAAATTSSDVRASYSNFGALVDIAAPGSAILTTDRGGGYSSVSGTSFASPNTAAVAALVMAANPSLTATDVLAVVSSTADDLGAAGWDGYYGHGRINALAAVQLASNADTSDVTPPTVAVAAPADYSSVSGDLSIVIHATDDFGVSSVDLYIDGRKVVRETQATSSGYLFAWDTTTASDGQHRISARASDAAGNVGVSQDIFVNVANSNDTTAPNVVITSPSDGATVSGNVSLSGYGSDDQGMSQFSLSVDGQLKCVGTSSASCNWNTRKLAAGSYTVTATAVDLTGNSASSSVSVTLGGSSSTGDSPGGGGKGKKNR